MMKGTVRELALVPREGGGPLSRFVARTAARLRLAEVPGVLPPDGVEGCLSTAQRMLADGHLAEAAALMVRTPPLTAPSANLSRATAFSVTVPYAFDGTRTAVGPQTCLCPGPKSASTTKKLWQRNCGAASDICRNPPGDRAEGLLFVSLFARMLLNCTAHSV
jgi:hypothetical protein